MRWLSICVVAYVMVAVVADQLRCQHSESHICSTNRNGRIFLDGHKVTMKSNKAKFSVSCDGWGALDFETLPRYTTEVQVATVKLSDCPLPASRSIVDVLTALNVNMLQTENSTNLLIYNLPSNPQLSTSHFNGLEHLTDLEIKSQHELTPHDNFLSSFINLRSLKLIRVSLPVENSSVPADLKALVLPATLEKFQLGEWKEKHPVPFGHCDNLRHLSLYKPSIETLPNRWIAACPHLEKIVLKSADDIDSLPSRLLEGATELKHLTITRCRSIPSLPEGLLQGAPNLVSLDLSHNRFHTISSEIFLGPKLYSLSLSSNLLTSEALKALAPLTSLTKLDLSYNQDFKNLCDQNGYSQIQNLTQLKDLSFWNSDVTHICRDWRETMTLLETLDLRGTDITKLTYDDLQFTRDASVKTAEVLFEEGSISSVSFTEDDYTNVLKTPAIENPVTINYGFDELECDCKMYWTRRALDIPNYKFAIPIDRLKCNDRQNLNLKTADQICPERATAKLTS